MPVYAPTTTAITQTAGDNSTLIATDAFVTTAVNNAIAGVNPAVAVQAATTAAGNTSGLTYNNGVSGVGATFTGSNNTALTIDGFTFTALGQRLLVKNDTQSPSGAFNGVYYVTQIQTAILPPILTRALDYDMPSDINNTGAIPVVNGTANATTSWVLTSTVNTVGTDPLTFTQFSLKPSTIMTTTVYDAAAIAQQVVGTTASQTLTNKTFDSTSPTAFNPPGIIQPYGARIAPTGWLKCDGSVVSRTTNANLFAVIVPSLGAFTITIAAPGVVTLTAHGLSTGDQVFLTTTGALPTGLSVNTLYYAVRIDANSFSLATSRANAYAGTKITTSGSQSGTHTAWDCPYGLGDGSTTFTLPDLRGKVIAGMDTTGGTAAGNLSLAQAQGVYGNLGANGGEQGHQITVAELASHSHRFRSLQSGTAGANTLLADTTSTGSFFTGQIEASGSDTAHNNVQPTVLVNYIIKT